MSTMLEIRPRSWTEKQLTNHIWTIDRMIIAIDQFFVRDLGPISSIVDTRLKILSDRLILLAIIDKSTNIRNENSRLKSLDKTNEFTRTYMRLAEDIRQQSAEITPKREILQSVETKSSKVCSCFRSTSFNKFNFSQPNSYCSWKEKTFKITLSMDDSSI